MAAIAAAQRDVVAGRERRDRVGRAAERVAARAHRGGASTRQPPVAREQRRERQRVPRGRRRAAVRQQPAHDRGLLLPAPPSTAGLEHADEPPVARRRRELVGRRYQPAASRKPAGSGDAREQLGLRGRLELERAPQRLLRVDQALPSASSAKNAAAARTAARRCGRARRRGPPSSVPESLTPRSRLRKRLEEVAERARERDASATRSACGFVKPWS